MLKKSMLSVMLLALLFVSAQAIEQSAESFQTINVSILAGSANNPIIADVQDVNDTIYYDSGLEGAYFSSLTEEGTLWDVRFTPEQPCSLSAILVGSYDPYGSTGDVIIHIMSSDDDDMPNEDLIDAFTATLEGVYNNYQWIDLPEAINIGEDDFHVVVEYTDEVPPYITVDTDGLTDYRSLFYVPSDGEWYYHSSIDINIRACVTYYGDDSVGPDIVHAAPIYGFTYDNNHPITATITDGSGVLTAEIHYSTDGTDWDVIDMTNSSDTYEADIPSQPVGTIVYYYITAVDASGNMNESSDPENAPDEYYQMEIVDGDGISYDDGTAEYYFYIATDPDSNAAWGMKMTPSSYPAKVVMVYAAVSDETPFYFTVNGYTNGAPGDILEGGEAVEGIMGENGWAVSELADGPTITSGSFSIVYHWYEDTPSNPGLGYDSNSLYYRSFYYLEGYGWNAYNYGEFMLRAVVVTPTGIEEIDGDGAHPVSFELLGNYPNPFNPTTEIQFLAPEAGNVRIDVYNVTGQLVKTVLNEYVAAGIKTVTWDGTNSNGAAVNSGVYFTKMTTANSVETKKMLLVK